MSTLWYTFTLWCRGDFQRGPWTVTLQPNVYNSFLGHCPVTELRRNTYRAYNMRASNYIGHEISNSIQIEEIRSLRYSNTKLQLLAFLYVNYIWLSEKKNNKMKNIIQY